MIDELGDSNLYDDAISVVIFNLIQVESWIGSRFGGYTGNLAWMVIEQFKKQAWKGVIVFFLLNIFTQDYSSCCSPIINIVDSRYSIRPFDFLSNGFGAGTKTLDI